MRHAETLTLLGHYVASRTDFDGPRSRKGYLRFTDDLYRRFLCPILSLIVGFLPVTIGYLTWTFTFVVLYMFSQPLLSLWFGSDFAEISRSSLYNWSVPLLALSFLLFPVPSIHSGSGVRSEDVRFMRKVLSQLRIDRLEEVEGLRDSIEIREQRMIDWIKNLRWASTVLWFFILFFVQGFFRSAFDDPSVSANGYLNPLPWLIFAAIIWFLLVQSYATTTNRILKTVHSALIERSVEIRGAAEDTNR